MKNSNELGQPLCLPYECREINTSNNSFPLEPQIHYFAEIVFVREGNLRIIMEKEEHRVSPGEMLLICPGIEHMVSGDAEQPFRLDLIRLDLNRMSEPPAYCPSLRTVMIEASRSRMPMVVPAKEAEEMKLSRLCSSCIRESAESGFGYDLGIQAMLDMICLILVRYWISKGLVLSYRELQTDPIYSLSGYIQQHLREGLRVENLAAHCGLSYPWFAKRFREIYGISCKDFIEQIRVGQVEQFLLFTEMDLNQISEETGYADCSHMIKNFKRIMDITPGQYRLQRR